MTRRAVQASAILAFACTACGVDHPAYDVQIEATDLQIGQSTGEPEERARLVVTVEVTPEPDHRESIVRLGATSRFESGVLRLYEPEPNSRFVYDGRKPVLAVPAAVVVGGRVSEEGVSVTDEAETFELYGQVSNLELATLCGERVVAVPRLVIEDPEASEEGSLRELRITAVGEVTCR